MKLLEGYFKDNTNEHTITITISRSDYEGQTINIGDNTDYDVCFGADPVTISLDCEDTFQVILPHRATINLISKIWLGDLLFANNITTISVQIKRDNLTIFDGYVEHNTFSQNYAYNWNEIQINCVDYLAVLENQRLSDLTDYATLKENSDMRTLANLINTILNPNGNINIYYDASKRAYTKSGAATDRVLNYLQILDNAWLGDSEDDLWTNFDIVQEIVKYINCCIVQTYDFNNSSRSRAFYIFDRDYLYKRSTGSNSIRWFKVNSAGVADKPISSITLTKESFASNDTNITIDQVYNKISIKEEAKDQDEIISNPLDTSNLNSPYSQFNRYMTEFVGLGTGRTAKRTLRGMIHDEGNTNWNESDGWFRHWYVKYIYNPQWQFNTYQHTASTTSSTLGWTPIISFDDTLTPEEGTSKITKDQYDYLSTSPLYETNTLTSFNNSQDQWSMIKAAWYKGAFGPTYFRYHENGSLPQYIYETGDPIDYPYSNGIIRDSWAGIYMPVRMPNCIGATMVEQWSTGKINPQDDTTPVKKENSGKWLYINVGNMLSNTVYNNIVTSEHGVCEYLTKTASSLIPPSDDIHYHLVFTGKIVLNPFITKVWNYWGTKKEFYTLPDDHSNQGTNSKFSYGMGGPSDNYNDGWTQYCRVYYDGTEPLSNLGDIYNQTHWVQPDTVNVNGDNMPLYIKDDGIKAYQYKEDRNNPGDTIKKVGVLLCRLRIGNKYLSEGYEEVEQEQDGETYHYYFPNNTYTWLTEDEWRAQYNNNPPSSTPLFTIGFNPKIGDWIIGQEYQIGTDISTYLNIDSTYGMDIQITREDNLSGQIEFTIIGPEATGWSDNYYRHRTWFRHSKVWSNTINLFNQNIQTTVGGVTITDPKRLSKAVANIAIGELKCTLYSDNGMNTFFKENDIIYMSDETNKYVEAKEDDEFKLISGFTSDEISKFGITIKPFINNVYDINNKPNIMLTPKITYVDGEGLPITKPEKLYVKRYYEEYKQPLIVLDTTLKYTGEDMFFNIYSMNFFEGKYFYPLSMETDLKMQTTTMKLKQQNIIS